MSRLPPLKPQAVQAREILAGGALPEPLKKRLQLELDDAMRRGFLVDLEQLAVAVSHFGDP